MKIIYISIAAILLVVGAYFGYKWYKGRNAVVTPTTQPGNNTFTPNIVATTSGPATSASNTPIR